MKVPTVSKNVDANDFSSGRYPPFRTSDCIACCSWRSIHLYRSDGQELATHSRNRRFGVPVERFFVAN
jgi:hypothetical protein